MIHLGTLIASPMIIMKEKYILFVNMSVKAMFLFVIFQLVVPGLAFAADLYESYPKHVMLSDSQDSLPDHVLSRGTKNIATAWLVFPAQHYAHGVLGDAVEATGVRVNLHDGKQLTLQLKDGSVFEDRYPRLLDVDGDGDDEMVLVRSYPDRGAALAVLEVEDDAIIIAAESLPIGKSYRWLNPIGVGDFDADGNQELAAILMPHLDGSLIIYRYDGKRLQPVFKGGRFSNHAMGSRALGLSAVADVNNDGRDEIIVPAFDRYSIVVLSLFDGQLHELDTIILDSPITSDMSLTQGEILTLGFCLSSGECLDHQLAK